MYIIIVGAGAVGYGLAMELSNPKRHDHEVVLIERDRRRALALREEVGELVVQGDGTEVTFLESIGTGRADLLIAVTGGDGANLVSCQVAKHWFHVGRTIARVNNPRNERLFRMLGIDSTVSAASAVLAQIEVDLPEHAPVPLMHLRGSGLEVIDLQVQEGSPAAGTAIRDLLLPHQTLISLVVGRDGSPRVPSGETVLQPGDEVIAVIPEDAESAVRALVQAPESDPEGADQQDED